MVSATRVGQAADVRTLDRRELLAAAAGAVAAGSALGRLADALAVDPDPRVAELGRLVSGSVLVPGSPGYGAARLVYNERFDAVRPLAVVRVNPDVVRSVGVFGPDGSPLVVKQPFAAWDDIAFATEARELTRHDVRGACPARQAASCAARRPNWNAARFIATASPLSSIARSIASAESGSAPS